MSVKKLLDLGAKCDPRNKQGLSPLVMAAARGCGPAVAALVHRGADAGLVLSGGSTVLHMSADMGVKEVCWQRVGFASRPPVAGVALNRATLMVPCSSLCICFCVFVRVTLSHSHSVCIRALCFRREFRSFSMPHGHLNAKSQSLLGRAFSDMIFTLQINSVLLLYFFLFLIFVCVASGRRRPRAGGFLIQRIGRLRDPGDGQRSEVRRSTRCQGACSRTPCCYGRAPRLSGIAPARVWPGDGGRRGRGYGKRKGNIRRYSQ